MVESEQEVDQGQKADIACPDCGGRILPKATRDGERKIADHLLKGVYARLTCEDCNMEFGPEVFLTSGDDGSGVSIWPGEGENYLSPPTPK